MPGHGTTSPNLPVQRRRAGARGRQYLNLKRENSTEVPNATASRESGMCIVQRLSVPQPLHLTSSDSWASNNFSSSSSAS